MATFGGPKAGGEIGASFSVVEVAEITLTVPALFPLLPMAGPSCRFDDGFEVSLSQGGPVSPRPSN